MLFAVIIYDRPDKREVRERFLDRHIQWLDEHRHSILVAGSLRQNEDDIPLGGLWIVEAQDKTFVEPLIRSDPFFVNGLRDRYEILHWSKAFEDRKTPV